MQPGHRGFFSIVGSKAHVEVTGHIIEETSASLRYTFRVKLMTQINCSLLTQTHDITYTHTLTHATHAPTCTAHVLTRATYAPMRATYAPTTYVPDTTHRHLTCHTYGHDWPGTHVHAPA
jgi:hypothetical protein